MSHEMQDDNPYSSPVGETNRPSANQKHNSRKQWALIGFALGAIVPIGYGVYGMQRHYAYVSSLGPNEAACGMGALGPMAMIFVVGPFCGIIGALSGWIASGIDWWSAL